MIRRAAPLLLLLSVLVHWPGPDAVFTYDDVDFVRGNQSIRTLHGALSGFALPFPPEQPQRALYRPLTNLSYAIDYAVWGDEARGFHVSNVLLYALCVLLVHRLALAYLGSTGFALSVALLFSVHPVHCDAVDGVAGRAELLALAFILVALLLFLRELGSRAQEAHLARWASALAFALACLSKENAAVLPAILAVHCWALRPPLPGAGPRGWLGALRPLLPHALVLVAYATLRSAVLGQLSPDAAILRDAGLWTRLLTVGSVFFLDLRLLVWPVPLEVDFYYQAAVGIPERLTRAALAGWLAAGGLLAVAAQLARRHFGAGPDAVVRERAVALAAFALFFGSLFPTSHFLDIGALFAERFLLTPSLGFLLLLVLAVRHAVGARAPGPVGRAALAGVVAVLAVSGAWRSHARAGEWRDGVALWRAADRHLVGDKRVYVNLADALVTRGELDAARAQLLRALALDADYVPALGSLGAIDIEAGRLDEAEATFRRIASRQPDDFLAHYNLGNIELRRGDCTRAAAHFRRALELNPNHAWSRTGLTACEAASQPQGSR